MEKLKGLQFFLLKDIEEEDKREMLVQFVTHNNESMPWTFKSEIAQLTITTGVQQRVMFVFENKTSEDMVGQVIPSVSQVGELNISTKPSASVLNNKSF